LASCNALFIHGQSLDDQKARFYEAEAHAPAGYPTLFVVAFASRQAGNFANPSQCSMEIETLGVSYSIGTQSDFSNCKLFPPKTILFGNLHNGPLGDQIIDLVDPRDAPKLKRHRYFVTTSVMLDPATQLGHAFQ
jgi:hypothetical protein